MPGQTFGTPSPEQRFAGDPIKPALAPLSFRSRWGAAGGTQFGAIVYLVSIGLVAVATIGVFFGLGFYLLADRPATGADNQGEAPAIVGTASSGIADRPIGSAAEPAALAMAGAAPPDTPAPQPAAKLSAAAPASAQATNPYLSAAEIAALLAQGKAAFRKRDIAAARLFYRRAAEAGEGRAALAMGATYDPTFLRRRALRISYGDPAEARAWYLQALALGAAGAERRLTNLQARAAR
jgi:hypothetical protein